MNRIRIMAGDFAPRIPLVEDELWVWDGRLALKPAIGKNGWFENAGTCSLAIPNGSTIKGMTVRGRVAHYDATFSVYIVRVPNGSHPNDWFDSQYTNDAIVKWLHLNPSLNNGYIHHLATRDDINHKVDLVNNAYMIRLSMHVNRDTVTPGFSDAYLTEVEIRYQRPSIFSRFFYTASISLESVQQISALGTKREFEERPLPFPLEIKR